MRLNASAIACTLACCAVLFYSTQVAMIYVYAALAILAMISIILPPFFRMYVFVSAIFVVFSLTYAIASSYAEILMASASSKSILLICYGFTFGFFGGVIFSSSKESISRLETALFALTVLLIAFIFSKYYPHDRYTFLLGVASTAYAGFLLSHGSYSITFRATHGYVASAVVILMLAINLFPAGPPPTKVAFANCYSAWINTSEPYTSKDWTLKANYSYSLLIDLLSRKYKVVQIDDRSDFIESVDESDVLAFIVPTVPLNNEEKKYVLEFVRKGGRLVLISDHTDLYGHGRVLNDLTAEFGFSIGYDAVFSPSKENVELEIKNSGVRKLGYMTGSSIKVKTPSWVLCWANDFVSEAANYNAPNFFGPLDWSSDDRYGDWPLGILLRYGEGTVAVWSDSTIFSNFAIFQPYCLDLLRIIFERGSFLANLAHWYPIILIGFTIVLLICFVIQKPVETLLTIFSLVSIFFSGSYYIMRSDPVDFYDGARLLPVYSEMETIRGSRPGRSPQSSSISSLYSSLPRFGVYPKWSGIKPTRYPHAEGVWFTTWDEFNANLPEGPIKTVIIDEIDAPERIGFEKKLVEIYPNKALNINLQSKAVYISRHPQSLHSSGNLCSAFNVLTDNKLGGWWSTIDISPYKKEMTKRFSEWLIRGEQIEVFSYPASGIVEGDETALMKYSDGESRTLENISFYFARYDETEYIYLGSELWGLPFKTQDSLLIIGGPELSDDYGKYGNARWVIMKSARQ